jgi:uncharacterized membrane protein
MISDQKLRLTSYILAGIGFLDAVYLTYVHIAHQRVLCGGYGGCDTVNTSPYSQVAGIPIAVFGAAAYLAIFLLLYLENKGDFWRENAPMINFGITLAGVLYTAYLTYLELAVIHAICFYCVLSAVMIVHLFILAIIRLANPQAETKPV